MTGLQPSRTIVTAHLTDDAKAMKNLDHVSAEQMLNIDELQSALEEMHKSVHEKITVVRREQVAVHNRQTNVVQPNFSVGDYVLVRRKDRGNHKLAFRWIGPRVITQVENDVVYVVRDLVHGQEEQVHASRLVHYRDDLNGKPVSENLKNHAQHTETKFEVIDEIVDIGEEDDTIWFRIKWMGLPDEKDFTWQRIDILYEDAPDMLNNFLDTFTRKKKVLKKARDYVSLLMSKDIKRAV